MPTSDRAGSLAERAAQKIRRLIVDGRLALGQALSETTLAAELGVSKTPVREALLRLRTEGLVEIMPQRGTFVFHISAKQAHALSEFRSMLETAALQCAMHHDGPALVRALRAIAAEMVPASALADSARYRALDDRFHRCIVEHCGNAFLSDAYEAIALLVQTLRNKLAVDPALNKRSLKEHRELARLLRRGKAQEAIELLRRHIAQTSADYAQLLIAPSAHPRKASRGGSTPVRPRRGG